LKLLLILPILGSLLIAILPSYGSNSKGILRSRVQRIALAISLLNFFISLLLIVGFNNSTIFFPISFWDVGRSI